MSNSARLYGDRPPLSPSLHWDAAAVLFLRCAVRGSYFRGAPLLLCECFPPGFPPGFQGRLEQRAR